MLVTGPTGSGKTTTLYAAVEMIRTGREKILTVEDPVEYELAGVPQVPVNEKVGMTFAGRCARCFVRTPTSFSSAKSVMRRRRRSPRRRR